MSFRPSRRLTNIWCCAFVALLTPLFTYGQPDIPDDLQLEPLREWLDANWYVPYFNDLGYSGARTQMFGYTDEVSESVFCIYTSFSQPAEFTTFLDPINTEHIIPQSFFGSISPMKSDLYNIRPSHGSANSARGNSAYAEVTDENAQWYGIDSSGNYVTQGDIPEDPANWSERSGSLWEPREEMKGDIARQVFYFYTVYPTEGGSISQLSNPELLYEWHLNDPVSDAEATRNARVQEVQGNANPYISDPLLVYRAWLWEESTVSGCMDESACNFLESATTDDGSCIFPEAGFDCDGNALESCTLFFSEYGEGTSNNKYLEIYNPGITELSLEGHALAHTVNAPDIPGTYETWVEFPLNASIPAGGTYLIVHSQATTTLLNLANFTYSNLSNGDDGFGLVAGDPTDYEILDIIGDWNGDPGSGWDVAGESSATANHTLVRKSDVLTGNAGEWINSAGTSTEDSEWTVMNVDDWTNVGTHTADSVCDVTGGGGGSDTPGCTYEAACNFDLNATVDDGSCEFTSCVNWGCTYPNALNYNMLATSDDGSCTFDPVAETCASDINADGLITVSDLLLLLTEFGGECP